MLADPCLGAICHRDPHVMQPTVDSLFCVVKHLEVC